MEKKIQVGILGATGMVGQKFIELLQNHPWFEITSLAASERSEGKPYAETVQWKMPTALPDKLARMLVQKCEPALPCSVVFSGLDSTVAGPIEESFAKAGYTVISNSRNHRMHPRVPLVIPEVNSDHIDLVLHQETPGRIVTNPNCSVIGIVTALKPLMDLFSIEAAHVVTMQAISGAGYPGVPSFDIIDNVIPFIKGEEEKVETEPLKIFGKLDNGTIINTDIRISAHCNRVPVMDGHTACISVKFGSKVTREELLSAWRDFQGDPQKKSLPSAPKHPIIYMEDERYPQPKLHRHLGGGMSVAVGRLRPCSLMDWKFVILSHNTIRGAAGCAILNAELMVAKQYI